MSLPATPAQPKRRMLMLLALLFFTPLLLSFALYYGSGWRPAGRTNHGVLIEPAHPLPRLAADAFSGRWSLVYIGSGDCDADCRNTLYYMRQTHLGLANLAPRVQRVFLVSANCCDRDYLAREQPGLITLNADAALLAQFPPERRASSDLHRRSARQSDDALRRS